MASIKAKVKDVTSIAKKYWNTPANGNYIPYKEVASLGVAGFGVQWTTLLASAIGLSASNFIVGACIGLKPIDLQIMLIVANLIGIPIAIWRGYIFDNHHMKGGKFIPFLLRTATPIVVISTIFVWLPYDNWSYIVKAIVVEIMYILLSFFLCLYNEGYGFLQQIITPNTQERATVMSITQIVYSLAPSITNLFIPTIAGLTFGMNNIKTYKIIYPIFTVIGLVLNLIFFQKVKERIVMPKHKIEFVRLSDAVREVAKNKYFWIINGATWIGFLESSYMVIFGWSFVYAFNGEKQALLGVGNTIIGNAALWAMLLAPLAIRALGKRNLLIICNVANIFLLALLYPTYKSLVMIIIIFYINGFVNVFSNIYLPTMNADMRDFHQWKTGVRVDGLFGPLGLIGTVLGFFTGLVVPAIFERLGLKDNYDVLYNDTIRNNIFKAMIVCSVIGALLNVIPYFFYDLTEDKHRGYIKVLKIRAMFEDFGYGDLSDDELVESVEIINNAEIYKDMSKQPIDKSILKAAKKMPKGTLEEKEQRKSEISKARADIRKAKQKNLDIISTPIVIDELNKFDTLRYKAQIAAAQQTIKNQPLTIYQSYKDDMEAAKAMPKSTKEEKMIRSDAINLARTKKAAAKLIIKCGMENIVNPTKDDENEINNRQTSSFADNIKQRKDAKLLIKNRSVYQRATKPYYDAKNLLIQRENYTHLDDIEEKYNQIITQKETSNI